MMGVKFHITSYRVWSPQAHKRAQTAPQKLTSFFKVAKFAGYIGIYLALIFYMNDFFVRFLVF